jgi:hypothetical protein
MIPASPITQHARESLFLLRAFYAVARARPRELHYASCEPSALSIDLHATPTSSRDNNRSRFPQAPANIGRSRNYLSAVCVELRVPGPLLANPWPRIGGLERTPAAGLNAVSVSQISTHLKERATKGSVAIQKKIALSTNAGSTSAIFSSEKPRDWSVSAESEKVFLMTAYLVICRVQCYFHRDY